MPVCFFIARLRVLRAYVAIARNGAASKTIQYPSIEFANESVAMLRAKVFIFVFVLIHFGSGVGPQPNLSGLCFMIFLFVDTHIYTINWRKNRELHSDRLVSGLV